MYLQKSITQLLLASVAIAGHAEIYRCPKDGATVYQDLPCAVVATPNAGLPKQAGGGGISSSALPLVHGKDIELLAVSGYGQKKRKPLIASPQTAPQPLTGHIETHHPDGTISIAAVSAAGGAKSAEPATQWVVQAAPSPGDASKEASKPAMSQETTDDSVYVMVSRPGKKVFLALSSYETVHWKVVPSQGTTIVGIIFGSMSNAQSTVNTRVNAPIYRAFLPYATQSGSADYLSLQQALQQKLGVNKIDQFKGSAVIPDAVQFADTLPGK